MAKQRLRQRSDRTLRIMAISFLTVAMIAFALGAWVTYDRVRFVSSSESATGTVIGFSESTRRDDGRVTTMYAPQIEFDAPNGEAITFAADVASNPPSYDVGETVDLLFDPQDPADAVIDSWWQKWFGSVIAAFLALIFGGFGLLMFRVGRVGARSSTEPITGPTESATLGEAGKPDDTQWVVPEDGETVEAAEADDRNETRWIVPEDGDD